MLGEKLDGRTTMTEIVTENPEKLNLLANKERIWYVVKMSPFLDDEMGRDIGT